MDKKDEVLKMANEALDEYPVSTGKLRIALEACKEALEQPAQEPVAWYWDNFRDGKPHADVKRGSPKLDGIFGTPIPLYTHPHQWQGLTDDEIQNIMWPKFGCDASEEDIEFARAIEQALKEKNG